ncbi:hypothetical protein N0M98_10270 [Paenibacillus doosanensis]|nr:hypothetical protein [Paenibacillus doosanensis]
MIINIIVAAGGDIAYLVERYRCIAWLLDILTKYGGENDGINPCH